MKKISDKKMLGKNGTTKLLDKTLDCDKCFLCVKISCKGSSSNRECNDIDSIISDRLIVTVVLVTVVIVTVVIVTVIIVTIVTLVIVTVVTMSNNCD